MRHAASEALYTYWNEVRRGRIAPERLEIQPARIGSILLDTFILERVDDAPVPFSPHRHTRVAAVRNGPAQHGFPRALEPLRPRHASSIISRRSRTVAAPASSPPKRRQLLATAAHPLTLEILVLPLVHTQQRHRSPSLRTRAAGRRRRAC